MPMSQGLLIIATSSPTFFLAEQLDEVWERAQDLWSVSLCMENSVGKDLLSYFFTPASAHPSVP